MAQHLSNLVSHWYINQEKQDRNQSVMLQRAQRWGRTQPLMCISDCVKFAPHNSSTMEVRLGGPSVIVQIDESLFRHKQKVVVCVGNRYIIIRYSNIAFSIIMEDVPSRRCGCLCWWTPHTTQPGVICKWWTEGMPTPTSLSSGPIHCLEQLFTRTSGKLMPKQ